MAMLVAERRLRAWMKQQLCSGNATPERWPRKAFVQAVASLVKDLRQLTATAASRMVKAIAAEAGAEG